MWKIITAILIMALGIGFLFLVPDPKEVDSDLYTPEKKNRPAEPNESKNQKPEGFSQAGIKEAVGAAISTELTPLAGQKRGQTNILFLGTPGAPHPAPNLTDSIMVAKIKYPGPKIEIVSIPRDFAVKASSGAYTKINSLYQSNLASGEKPALEVVKNKIERITGLNIHYYVKVDLAVLGKVLEKLGGVNIRVPEDIKDNSYPGPNYTYQTFEVKRGWRYLSPEEAVKFIRTRHSRAGDLDRVKRQKALVAAMITKVENMPLLKKFSTIIGLRNALRQHISSNLSLKELKSCYALFQELNLNKIKVAQLDIRGPDALLKSSHMDFNGIQAYVLIPRPGLGDYSQIRDFFTN